MDEDETGQPPDAPTRTPSGAPDSGALTNSERAAEAFYEVLRKNGQLIDVEANMDLSSLPEGVTHVRYPDGRIERVGFV